MVNETCHPSLCTKQSITTNISTSTYHWTGENSTHHIYIGIATGGLNTQPNSTPYAAPPLSTIKYFFFNGHYIHFEDCTLSYMEDPKIKLFVLKPGKYINYQPNDNGRNEKLKFHYNDTKSPWMMKYGAAKLLPSYMRSILVESQVAFKVSTGNP